MGSSAQLLRDEVEPPDDLSKPLTMSVTRFGCDLRMSDHPGVHVTIFVR